MRPLLILLLATPLLALGLLAAAAVLLFSNYETSHQGRIYSGVSALGVDLSGQTREGATRLLNERAARLTSQPLVLSAQGQEWPHTAGSLGLEMDVDGLVQQALAVGRQGDLPRRMLAVWSLRQEGLSFATLESSFNPLPLRDALAGIATQIERPMVNAQLLVVPDAVHVTEEQTGLTLDQEDSFRQVRAAVDKGETRVALPVVESLPAVRNSHVEAAAQVARHVLSGPLVARFEDRVWTLGRDELYDMLRIERGVDGVFETTVDTAPLERLAQEIASEVEQAPEDARFDWADGKLEVLKPSRSGRSLEPRQAVEALLAAVMSPNHQVELPVQVVKPMVPMEDRHTLGITELVQRSSTSFAGSVAAKKHNIRLAAERINGAVVAPGEVFSFNRAVGPTTLEAGFQWGYAIQGGASGVPKTIPSVAGGICQVATTLLHSVFWAGYPVEERYPHLYWIPAYLSNGMVGIDTTVDEVAGLDFQFVNPSAQHLLVQAWADKEDKLHFALYGTRPTWKVEVEGPNRTNPRPAVHTPVTEEDATMPYGQRVAVESARDGFDVRLVRKVISDGDTRTLNLTSRYQASRNVTLVGTLGRPASAKPSPAPTSAAQPAAQSTLAAVATPTPGAPAVTVPASPSPQAPRNTP